MTEVQYEAKFKEMQKYLPFLEKVINKLKHSNDEQLDNPRKAQLQKMQMLLDLLTNKGKSLKLETLLKCENILIKLHSKIEKVKTNQQENVYDLTGPESPPPPEQNASEEHAQPVEIPTERRCSPLLVDEKKPHHHNRHYGDQHQRSNMHGKSGSSQPQRHNYYSRQDQDHRYKYQERTQTKSSEHHSPSLVHRESHQHLEHKHRHKNVDEYAKISTRPTQSHTTSATEQYLQKVKVVITESSPLDDHRQDFKTTVKLPQEPTQSIQKVKVVITEPLSSEVIRQQFPSLPLFNKAARFSTNNNIDVLEHCRNSANLQKSLNNAEEDNEAYSPQESWDEYSRKKDNIKIQNTRELHQSAQKSVFSRLGSKIENEKPVEMKDLRSPSTHTALPKSIPARVTPIPDVLKSPPLSASDITNLLNETSDDNVDNSLSEIGQRRPKKPDSSRQIKYDTPIMTSSSLDFVRKKFAMIAKLEGSDKKVSPSTLNRPPDSPASPSSSTSVPGTPTERLALKYNPHPRSERDWSVSSHDSYSSTGGSYLPKAKDSHSHANNKLPTTPVSNVNVLPTINLNDPRLKRTNSIIPMQTSPTLTKSPLLCNQTVVKNIPKPFNGSRNDPRLNAAASRASLEPHPPGIPKAGDISYQWQKKETIAAASAKIVNHTSSKKPSNKPTDYSSEENWDSEPETLPKVKGKNSVTSDNQLRVSLNSMDADEENRDSDSDVIKKAKVKGPLPSRTTCLGQQSSHLGLSNQTRTLLNSVNFSLENRDSDSEILKVANAKNPIISRHSSSTQQHSQLTLSTVQNFIKKDALLPAPNNRFNAALNDKTERMKYLESKRFKDNEPKTYKEFREAKAKLQEAAKKALQKAGNNLTVEKTDEKKLKDQDATNLQKTSTECNTLKEGKAEKPDTLKKTSSLNDNKKKIPEKACSITETALDKMYRTQNFRNNFCNKEFAINKNKFKIPKKKSEETIKKSETTESALLEKVGEKIMEKQINGTSMASTGEEEINVSNQTKEEKTKKDSPSGEKGNKGPDKKNPIVKILDIKSPKIASILKKSSTEIKKKLIKSKEGDLCVSKTPKISNSKEKGKITEDSSVQTPTTVSEEENSAAIQQDEGIKEKQLNESRNINTVTVNLEIDVGNKNENLRIPLLKNKEQSPRQVSELEEDKHKQIDKVHVDQPENQLKKPEDCSSKIALKSSNTNVNLLSNENFTQSSEQPDQPSRSGLFKTPRILRRRSTMISYGSAPEVDKKKLMESNSLLFEDVQVQQWRKENLTVQLVRRNRNLEGIFQKTDDNCTVSTQNIISGKRRTRAAINFNETQNVKAIFNKKRATEAADTKKDKSEELKHVKEVKTGGRRSKTCTPERENSEKERKDGSECTSPNGKETPTREKSKSLEDVNSNEKNIAKGNKTKPATVAKKEDIQTRSSLNNRKKACLEEVADVKEIEIEKERKVPVKSTEKDNENQNDAASSTSTELPLRTVEEQEKNLSILCGPEESNDNEPNSSSAISANPTPIPLEDETNRHAFLNEFVQEIFKPDSNKEHILSLLRQILDKDKFEFIKTVIESAIKNREEHLPQTPQADPKAEKDNKDVDIPADSNVQQKNPKSEEKRNNESDCEELSEDTTRRKSGKKKRSELDRLNDDIRDMFISQGVLTATGKRMCTLMAQTKEKKNVAEVKKTPIKEDEQKIPPVKGMDVKIATIKKERVKKSKNIQPPLRRSLRRTKLQQDNEATISDDEVQVFSCLDSSDAGDETNSSVITTSSIVQDNPQSRKLPILIPISKVPEIDELLMQKLEKEEKEKRDDDLKNRKFRGKLNKSKRNQIDEKSETSKSDAESREVGDDYLDEMESEIPIIPSKPCPKSKKPNANKGDKKECKDQEADEKVKINSEIKSLEPIKNTNINWHNQSKYVNWCMICSKKLQGSHTSALHYKLHHCENYVSRFAPIILQKFKQGKLAKPLFGVKRSEKSTSWFHRCPFCLTYFINPMNTWIAHFQEHTAEYKYECSNCFRGSQRLTTIRKHVACYKSCKGAKVVNTVLKLTDSNWFKAHVCHLCNFVQLKRNNLERHYVYQHHVNEKNVELLGYTVTLFNADEVECVDEIDAAAREEDAWKKIRAEEEIIDIDDDNDFDIDKSSTQGLQTEQETSTENEAKDIETSTVCENEVANTVIETTTQLDNEQQDCSKDVTNTATEVLKTTDVNNDNEQDWQDELLSLAAKAAENVEETDQQDEKAAETMKDTEKSPNLLQTTINVSTRNQSKLLNQNTQTLEIANNTEEHLNTFSTSVTVTSTNHNRTDSTLSNKRPSTEHLVSEEPKRKRTSVETKPVTLRSLEPLDVHLPEADMPTELNASNTASTAAPQQAAIDNAFVTSRNSTDSPTIDTVTLAQSFVQLDDLTTQSSRNEKPTICTSIAERISQLFKNMKETDQATKSASQAQAIEAGKKKLETLPSLVAEDFPSDSAMVSANEDDEDWEDIEITESAPSTCVSTVQSTGSSGKAKGKGLFQKFIFKGAKPKKLSQPVMYFGKKKTTKDNKDSSSLSQATVVKEKETFTLNANGNSCNLGFKPVINIIDDLLPDSPCHDPIELALELAPLEPLQDLNDISSILDADLSGNDQPLCIDTGDHQTSIEDALDFINEQRAQEEKQQQHVTISSSNKSVANRIQHVGYSLMANAENKFKFYCLLDNCSFLFSSDSMGLENHYMLEHAATRWNGYCMICQTQVLAANEEHPIIKEIRHMVKKHAKPVKENEKDFLANGNSNSNSGASEERPRIKLRRLTGDCLSATSSENSLNTANANAANVNSPINSLLGALLSAKPRPPTKEMPAPPLLPITEPLLMDDLPSLDPLLNLQISQVVSLGAQQQQKGINNTPPVPSLQTTIASAQLPKIMNVCSLNTKAGSLWSQHIARERQDLAEALTASKEMSQIVAQNQSIKSASPAKSTSPEPIVVSETVPVAQARAGDFVITQTLSAQYEGRQTQEPQLGINISISSASLNVTATAPSQQASKQFKCMGNGCKYLTRVPVAMSDHLRFHEKRNLSFKRDYLNCGFCQYTAESVDNYMKHAEEVHAIAKTTANGNTTGVGDKDTATTLSRKIQDILRNQTNSKNTTNNSNSAQNIQRNTNLAAEKSSSEGDEEVFLKKLSETIEEIVSPTGLSENKLYRCVVKDCLTPLTEATFNQHVMFHTNATGCSKDSKYYYKCPHCPVQYLRPAGLKAHIKVHARSRFFCYLCDEIASNPGQMLKHFTETHWHTLNMNTTLLLNFSYKEGRKQELSTENSYYVVYTQQLEERDVKEFGKKLIAEWQRKKATSKTHFKSTEIDLLPIQPIFQREINCGECEYRTKVRTNMYRHLLMHKQTEAAEKTGAANIVKVASVDPVNPVPCLNTNEKFFDKMTNLASSSVLTPHSKEQHNAAVLTKPAYKMPFTYINDTKRYTCGALGCKYLTVSEEIFRSHLITLHSKIMIYRCPFCESEVCKRGLSVERITAHLKFHGPKLYRCEECNYLHYLRFLVERHINEKHSTQKVNLIKHERVKVGEADGNCTSTAYTGKKYKEPSDLPSSNIITNRPQNAETSQPPPSTKSKHKWVCDLCDHRTVTLSQIQSHCSAEHGQKHQYQCVHCTFGSTQLSQILHHIDEKHNGKTREARYMYHRAVNSQGDETNAIDTRPLWQRNDPTRVRHIRGILMEDEEESERNRRRFVSAEDDECDDYSNALEEEVADDGGTSEVLDKSFMTSFEFGCLYCNYKSKTFSELKQEHWLQQHNAIENKAKPFYFRLLRRFSCAECRQFTSTHEELRVHLTNVHGARYCAADITRSSDDKLLCGYCSFSCNTYDQLYKHHQRRSHQPQDLRIEHGLQMAHLLKLGTTEKFLQCCLCNEIFANRSVIVAHASERHSKAEGFSFRELSDKLIYCCVFCPYASISEAEACRHMIGHYGQFKCCHFCQEPQTSFEVYMQHCYSEHREGIRKFKDIFPFKDIRKFLLQLYILFPNGLVVNKRNMLKCKYGSLNIIHQVYYDLCKTSQQPPIPRLSLGRLVAKMGQEQKPNVGLQPKAIKKRRCTIAVDSDEASKWPMLKPPSPIQQTNSTSKSTITATIPAVRGQQPKKITQRRCTVALGQDENPWSMQAPAGKSAVVTEISTLNENPSLQTKKLTKRRRTITNDCCIDPSSDNSNCSSSHLLKETFNIKKRKLSDAMQTRPPYSDMEPYSFYGKPTDNTDLSKIYTKAAIGGLDAPITIDKFKLLFNIDARVVLSKYDGNYCNYKHITKACPASQKFRYT
uniref:C2H2-type domain-containing protein n=1 Tax=Glossina brevipalpis TaxID=37001 RepID=A0A1A9W643_9MUSC